ARVPARPRTARPPAVAVVTTTAGGATTVVDPLAVRGVTIAQPSEETFARLAAAGIKAAKARIVELTIAGAHSAAVNGTPDLLLRAPECDLVVAVRGSPARTQREKSVKPLIDSARATRPLAAYLVPDAPVALAQLADAGVPAFRTPEACADAVAAALRRRVPVAAPAAKRVPSDGARLLDEFEAYALLDRLGISRAPALALDATARAVPALPFAFPVAAKVLSADIPHKP